MNLSKKQKVIILVTVLLALFFLGLRERGLGVSRVKLYEIYITPDVRLQDSHELSLYKRSIVGRYSDLLRRMAARRLLFITAIVIIGLTAVITSKKKPPIV